MSLTDPTSTRRGPRDQRAAVRRTRLLDAGLEAFGGHGYVRSAIEDICVRAAVGTRSFYNEFPGGKEDLLIAVYDRQIEAVAASLTEALERQPTDLERYVRDGVRAFVDPVTADLRGARVQLLEVVGASERVERHRREVLEAFTALLMHHSRRLHEARLASRPYDRLTAVALVGAANELLTDWMLQRRRAPRARVVDALTRLNVGALR